MEGQPHSPGQDRVRGLAVVGPPVPRCDCRVLSGASSPHSQWPGVTVVLGDPVMLHRETPGPAQALPSSRPERLCPSSSAMEGLLLAPKPEVTQAAPCCPTPPACPREHLPLGGSSAPHCPSPVRRGHSPVPGPFPPAAWWPLDLEVHFLGKGPSRGCSGRCL